LLVDADQIGAGLLVAKQQQKALRNDRRRGRSIKVVKRAKAASPPLFSLEGIGDQTEIGEENVDAVVVGGGRGRCRIVGAKEFLRLFTLELAPPEFASCERIVCN